MDGYTSSVAALTVSGMRQTYPAKAPEGVVADENIFADAPSALTCAGFGDIMGKFTSVTDWRMEELVEERGDFCEILADEAHEIASDCIKHVTGILPETYIRQDKPHYHIGGPGFAPHNVSVATAIMSALINSGIVMQKAGHSKPASGGEHHLSHFWEMAALLEGKLPALHGAKVGVSTLVALQAQEWLMKEHVTPSTWEQAEREATNFNPAAWHEEIRQSYANVSDEILALWPNENAQTRLALLKRIQDKWPSLQGLLYQNAGLLGQVKSALAGLGCPTLPATIGVSRDVFMAGVMHAHRLRQRFTIWRLLDIMGLHRKYASSLAGEYYS